MEGKVIRLGNAKYRVNKEYYSDTYKKNYLLLEDQKDHELFVVEMDEEGYVQEVATKAEMTMLEIVFGEGE